MWGLVAKGVKSVAAGRTQADLGLQSPHLPNALTRIGRFLYSSSALWIAAVWYSGYANMRTEPGSGPQIVLPGKKVINTPDRPNRNVQFATTVGSNSTAAGNSTQFVTTPNRAGRKLIAIGPSQMGVPGTAVAGFLWSAPNNEKQLPAFNRATYQGLTAVASRVAQRYGLRVTSGYRPSSAGSLHASGLAFDMVGPMANMKRAATWAATNPSMFQEIFIHNEGSGMHLHLGFYPDAAATFNAGANRMVRSTDTPQKSAAGH